MHLETTTNDKLRAIILVVRAIHKVGKRITSRPFNFPQAIHFTRMPMFKLPRCAENTAEALLAARFWLRIGGLDRVGGGFAHLGVVRRRLLRNRRGGSGGKHVSILLFE